MVRERTLRILVSFLSLVTCMATIVNFPVTALLRCVLPRVFNTVHRANAISLANIIASLHYYATRVI
jgi:hypothetical protein